MRAGRSYRDQRRIARRARRRIISASFSIGSDVGMADVDHRVLVERARRPRSRATASLTCSQLRALPRCTSIGRPSASSLREADHRRAMVAEIFVLVVDHERPQHDRLEAVGAHFVLDQLLAEQLRQAVPVVRLRVRDRARPSDRSRARRPRTSRRTRPATPRAWRSCSTLLTPPRFVAIARLLACSHVTRLTIADSRNTTSGCQSNAGSRSTGWLMSAITNRSRQAGRMSDSSTSSRSRAGASRAARRCCLPIRARALFSSLGRRKDPRRSRHPRTGSPSKETAQSCEREIRYRDTRTSRCPSRSDRADCGDTRGDACSHQSREGASAPR